MKRIVFLLSVVALAFFCMSGPAAGNTAKVWWVAGDAHARGSATGLDQAISDINSLELGLDYAIQLGDNVSDRHDYGDAFLRSMERLNVDGWGYVLGNHDFGRDNEPVLPVRYWAKTVNGIMFIFLSDEMDGRMNRDLVMSRRQSDWFFSELEDHEDKPVILFTHQPHTEFDLFHAVDFERYNIVAWFHAHKHYWVIEGLTEYGFHQLGINAISGARDPRKSAVLFIEETERGSRFTLRFRNHDIPGWISVDGEKEYSFFVKTASGD